MNNFTKVSQPVSSKSSVLFFGILFAFLFTVCNYPQYQNVKVSDAVNPYEPQECSIVISPQNSNNMLAAANMNHYFYSTDAGLTWTHGTVESPWGVIGDPVIAAGADGKFYYFHLVPDLSRVVSHKLTSFNADWSEGTFTGLNGTKENDKDWGVINTANNYLYTTWSEFDEHGSTDPLDSSCIKLSYSTDEGETWASPVRISTRKGDAMGGNYSCHSPMPAVGPGNDVYVTWWSPQGLMFDKSTDGGVTWRSEDISVTDYHVNWLLFGVPGVQRMPGFPVITCDLSGGVNNGNIYICWTDARRASNNTDIWMVKSTDGGLTWSTAKRVNDDLAARHQFFGTMTIDQVTGYLYFAFYDRRNYTTAQTDVYVACSKDGGETFENFKVSETPFTPYQTDFIGDYIGISAYNNIIRPIWTRVDGGVLSLWTAIVTPPVSANDDTSQLLPSEFEIISAFPNPFNASTTIKYTLSKSGNVTLDVYDVLSKKVAALVDSYQPAGVHELTWKADDFASGTYFLQLRFGDELKTQKVVLLK